MKVIKIAILDMYDNAQNEGMRCILQQLEHVSTTEQLELTYHIFNVRSKNQIPDLNFDIYISTGGPGSPLPLGEAWEIPYFSLINKLFEHNQTATQKKFLFLICHSFQLVSRHFKLGLISKRRSTSFGVFPIHKTDDGLSDPYFQGLSEPFFAVDSRDYQFTKPNLKRIERMGAKILCLEKIRPHIDLERAVMAIRFSDEVFGTQFHPEADSEGMLRYFMKEEKKQQVLKNHGEEKYNEMVASLQDPEKIQLTESVILPTFLRHAISFLTPETLYSHDQYRSKRV